MRICVDFRVIFCWKFRYDWCYLAIHFDKSISCAYFWFYIAQEVKWAIVNACARSNIYSLQAVLQLIICPFVNYWYGEETFGSIAYYMSIVYILAQSVGYALCQTRWSFGRSMKQQKETTASV